LPLPLLARNLLKRVLSYRVVTSLILTKLTAQTPLFKKMNQPICYDFLQDEKTNLGGAYEMRNSPSLHIPLNVTCMAEEDIS